MVRVRAIRPVGGTSRWFGLAALVLVAGALIPAALALACNPQAYLTLDKAQYAPGETVRVAGSFFKNNVDIKVSVDRTGQSTTVRTSGNGTFTATFALPSNAGLGAYGVEAIGFESNGSVTPGLPAPGSFIVAAPAPAPQTSTGGDQQSTSPSPSGSTSATGAPAPQAATPSGTRPTARPSSGTSSSSPSSRFREPRVVDEPNVQRSTTGRTTSRRSSSDAGVAGTDGASSNVGGRAVFGGSIAPSVSVPAAGGTAVSAAPAASRSTARSGSAVSPQTAEQTATDDVWGSLGSGRAPSVLPVAGDGVAVSSPRAGSQLALGLVLLGGGVLALIGGLAAGEARSRRVRAR
jgi:hypothetical protein